MIMTSVSHLITSHARLIFVTDCRKLTLSIALEWTATAYCSYKVYVKARQVVAKLYWAGALACTHTHTHVLIAGWFNSLPYCSLLGNDVVCKLKQKLIHLLLSNQNINNTKHYGNKTNKCTWKYVNFLHSKRCKPPTYFVHLLWPSSGMCFTKDVLQRHEN